MTHTIDLICTNDVCEGIEWKTRDVVELDGSDMERIAAALRRGGASGVDGVIAVLRDVGFIDALVDTRVRWTDTVHAATRHEPSWSEQPECPTCGEPGEEE